MESAKLYQTKNGLMTGEEIAAKDNELKEFYFGSKVKNQVITENYALYESDCMYVLPTLPAESVDLSVYSPPFAGLYNYSSSENDFSNCESREQFLQQYDFLIAEIARVTKPGCVTAVHVTDIMGADGDLWDFPHEVKKLHQKHGFKHRCTVTIWKEPLKVRMRTMVKSLMHLMIVEDSTQAYPAMPDYLLLFEKRGERAVKVTHEAGLHHYAGEYPLLPHIHVQGKKNTPRPFAHKSKQVV